MTTKKSNESKTATRSKRIIKHDKSTKETSTKRNSTDNLDISESEFKEMTDLINDCVTEKTNEQLLMELKAGFHNKWCELILELIHYENRRDFESKLTTCRYALYLAADFESKEIIDKYEMMFRSVVWTIGVANKWIDF